MYYIVCDSIYYVSTYNVTAYNVTTDSVCDLPSPSFTKPYLERKDSKRSRLISGGSSRAGTPDTLEQVRVLIDLKCENVE